MEKIYTEFKNFLENEDKENAVKYILNKLNKNEFDIISLYEKVLEPALNNSTCLLDEKICIWKEHLRRAIVRTVIESCYTKVLEARDKNGLQNGLNVVILCPDGETDEIGARIIADYFTIYGFNTFFVGSDIPKKEFLDVINVIKPEFIVINVTNVYNIFSVKKIIKLVRDKENYGVKIIVSGKAFKAKPDIYGEIGADIMLLDNNYVIKDLVNRGDK